MNTNRNTIKKLVASAFGLAAAAVAPRNPGFRCGNRAG
jgi:hypothetical protein